MLAHMNDQAPVGLATSRHRRIENCNVRFADMFGYRPDELKGRSLSELYPSPREFEETGARWLKEMTAGLSHRDKRIMRRRDGHQFWCQVLGRSTTPEDPFARCVWAFVDMSEFSIVVGLTARERAIASLLVEGRTNKEVGRALGISYRTVEAHRMRMMTKLGAGSPAELIARLVGGAIRLPAPSQPEP
ncbi:MAG: PAS domain S-box protein [Rhizobiaceae bacterium]|nr:MAG: PAS domain S-box protein [Rhizobiaceae bacterium]CAG1016068.1 Tetrathionate response regulatory protein TtrR [Rhizobiaceae bacterium]